MREGTFAEQAVPLLRQWGVPRRRVEGYSVTGPLTTGDAETEIRSVLEITVPFRQYTAEVR